MTESADLLRKTIADFFEVDEAQVGPAFRLDSSRGQGSIGRAALDAAIRRRVGVKAPAIYSARTFGELIGEDAPAVAIAPATPSPSVALPESNAIACGVDMELVANLPDSADHWEDAFYRTHFAPGEIAYCLLQDDPKPHFAARWCAKEALKKCEASLMAADFREIEVASEDSGAPYLMHQGRRLPHAVSLSHTPTSAVAVVVKGSSPAPVVVPSPPPRPVLDFPSAPAAEAVAARPGVAIVAHIGRSGRGGPGPVSDLSPVMPQEVAAEPEVVAFAGPPPMNRGDRNENPRGIGFLALLGEDLRTHDGNLFEQGFWAVSTHRFGNWRMGLPRPLRIPCTLLYNFLFKWVEWTCGISLPYPVKLGRRVRIWHHSGMVLNARSIGDDVHIRQNTTFGLVGRDTLGVPTIEARADIGCNVCIAGEITVGHDSRVGANTLVVADVPPYATVAGVPARIIKRGSPEAAS